MTPLVHVALFVRRSARDSYGFVAAGLFLALCLLGVFGAARRGVSVELVLAGTGWLAVFVARVFSRRARDVRGQSGALLDLELGLLLLGATHAVVQFGGGLTSDLYPLVYVFVACVASFARNAMGAVLVACALAFEAALYFVTEQRSDLRTIVLHASFVTLFGGMNLMFTRAEIARVRQRSRKMLDEEKIKAKESARLFRLVSPSSTETGDDERLLRSSVDEARNQLFHILDLLRRTLDLHTCVLLLLDEEGTRLRIVELATESDDIADGPFSSGEGAVGAVAKRGLVTNLEHIKLGYSGLCYYRGPALIRAFLGVPVLDAGQVRGALCADRLDDRPFTKREEEVLREATQQILRTLQNERLFVQVERAKREQSTLYRASQALGSALNANAVIDAALAAAGDIAPFDLAAVTSYDPQKRVHTVQRAVGEGANGLTNLRFRDNTSLTAMVVKNRHYLPYRGDFDPKQQTVYTRRTNLRSMQSLLILPLVVREDAMGTFALAAKRPDAFTDAVRPTLQMLANQLAVSLANAASVRRLEELATTDGLTGCLNKRAFLDELERKMRAAERFKRRLSLIVTDIDHFKTVNDTYGHATGDSVIKELGALLQRIKRETDVVARFGGEEFCVLCEETGTDGAMLLAERAREMLGETVFHTELGTMKVTCSLGVATFPDDAKTAKGLFEAADKALYDAKHRGRNLVRTAARAA